MQEEQIDSRSKQVYNAEEIDALKKRYPNGLKYRLEPFQEKVGDENRLDLANFFACAICTMVVKDPLECKGCDSLFCKECLEPWTSKNEHCPKKCKGNEAVEFGTMHRFAKQELQALKFKCKSPNCDKVHKYADALAHIHTCEHQLQPCPQGCGMGIHGQDLEYHTKVQCAKTKHICKDCEEDVFPNDREQNSHNCLQTLKKLLAASRQENEALKQQLSGAPASRRAAPRQSSVENESEDEEEVEAEAEAAEGEAEAAEGHADLSTCLNGHELNVHYGSLPAGYSNVICDICEAGNLHHQELFFRCGPCNYDICLNCATNGGIEEFN